MIKSFMGNPFIVKHKLVYFYHIILSGIKTGIDYCIADFGKTIGSAKMVVMNVLKQCIYGVPVVIKILNYAFMPLWVLRLLAYILLGPSIWLLIFIIETAIGIPITAFTIDPISLISQFFIMRFGSSMHNGVLSHDKPSTSHANVKKIPVVPIEPPPVNRLYLDPHLTGNDERILNAMVTIMSWIEIQNLPRLNSLADRNTDKMHWFNYQSPKLLSKGVLIELFSTHRDTRLKKIIEFITIKKESKDLAGAISLLLSISFSIRSPIPINFTVGLEVPNITRRPFERFIENMMTTLQSSQSTFICDFMLANLTDGTNTVNILNNQWNDKESTSNQKHYGAPFIDEFLLQPFMLKDPTDKLCLFNRLLIWFKHKFTNHLSQDIEIKFLHSSTDKILRDLHALQEIFWFQQPTQHPHLISSLDSSTIDTEDYEQELLENVNEILQDSISQPTDIPDVPIERQLTRQDQIFMIENFRHYDFNEELVGSSGKQLNSGNMEGLYQQKQSMSSTDRQISSPHHHFQYPHYAARLFEQTAYQIWEFDDPYDLGGKDDTFTFNTASNEKKRHIVASNLDIPKNTVTLTSYNNAKESHEEINTNRDLVKPFVINDAHLNKKKSIDSPQTFGDSNLAFSLAGNNMLRGLGITASHTPYSNSSSSKSKSDNRSMHSIKSGPVASNNKSHSDGSGGIIEPEGSDSPGTDSGSTSSSSKNEDISDIHPNDNDSSEDSDDHLMGSGDSFAEVFLTEEERAEFKQHFASLSNAIFGDVEDLRKKMSSVTRILKRLMSGPIVDVLNNIHALSLKGETSVEINDVLQKLKTQYKMTIEHYRHYEEYIEEFELGFAFYRGVEFADDNIREVEKLFLALEKSPRVHRNIMHMIQSGLVESTRVNKNLKMVVEQYISSSVHLKDRQRQREFRKSIDSLLDKISRLGYKYTQKVDEIHQANLGYAYGI